MTTACFVAWPLAPDAVEGVGDAVRDALADAGGPGVTDLLPDVGAATVSVLRYDAAGDDPRLVWYVEHESGAAWTDPARVVREHSPLWPALEAHLADGDPIVVADAAPDATELVHAFLPDRPTAWTTPDDDGPVLLPRDDDGAGSPDVVPLRLELRPGLGTLAARAVAGLVRHTPARLEAKFEEWTEPVLEAEGMYTETLLLERTDRGFDLWWYMEAGDMGQVQDGFEESDSYVARLSEPVFGWFLEEPGRAFGDPVASTRFELLAHAVAPSRG